MTAQRCPEATYRTKPLAKRAAYAAADDATRRNSGQPRVRPGRVVECAEHCGWHVLGDVQPTTTVGRVS